MTITLHSVFLVFPLRWYSDGESLKTAKTVQDVHNININININIKIDWINLSFK